MKNKILKRTTLSVLCIIICYCIMPGNAMAQGPIDLDKDVTLNIRYQYEQDNIAGIPFGIFRVADVSPKDIAFTPTDDFAAAPVQLNGLDAAGWKIAAETLAAYAQGEGLSPLCSGQTDGSGLLAFPGDTAVMKAGLYLAVSPQTRIGDYIYTTEPLLICLPGRSITDNSWDYTVTVNPKAIRRYAPELPDTITLKALKIWDDDGNESIRPREITVYLLKNGEVFDTVTLNAENSWRYIWTDLSPLDEWQVMEENISGYTTTVSLEGITFMITNTYRGDDAPPEPTPPGGKLPQTGTTWYIVPVLACAGLLFLVMGALLRRWDKKHEA